MVYQDDIDKCLTDLKSTCKAKYVFGGPAPEMGTTMGQMMGKGGRIKKRKTKKARKTRKTKRRKSLRPIKINPKMKGNFTKKAKKANMSVQQYARYVIKKYKGKTKTKKQVKLLREAVFARNAKTKFKH